MKKGFTLIELLVVVAIIALLATLAVIGVTGAQRTARDSKRKADLEVVRSALELYKADCDLYPALGTNTGNFSFSGSASFQLTGTSGAAGARCASANVYLTAIPKDPKTGPIYKYTPNAARTGYSLCSTLEKNNSLPSVSCNGSDCGGGNTCYYLVANP